MRVLPAPPLSSERGAGVSAGCAGPLRTKAHPMRVQFDLAALDQTFGVKTKSYLQVYTSVIRLTEILHAQASVPSQEVCLYLQAIDRCEHAQNRRRCHSHGPLEHRTPTSVRHANTPLRPMRLRLQLLSPKTALPLLKETTRIRLCFRLP